MEGQVDRVSFERSMNIIHHTVMTQDEINVLFNISALVKKDGVNMKVHDFIQICLRRNIRFCVAGGSVENSFNIKDRFLIILDLDLRPIWRIVQQHFVTSIFIVKIRIQFLKKKCIVECSKKKVLLTLPNTTMKGLSLQGLNFQ